MACRWSRRMWDGHSTCDFLYGCALLMPVFLLEKLWRKITRKHIFRHLEKNHRKVAYSVRERM
jgi:hypothetical protein